MQIIIKTLLGEEILLVVDPSATIRSVKEQLLREMPYDQQRLVLDGKPLEDDHTLSSYNIQTGATIHLVLRLKTNSSGSKDLERAVWS